MGRRHCSATLPSSPTHSSSSSFEFFTNNISSLSPHESSAADDLFCRGHLLPLHLSPRLSMLCTLLSSPPSTYDDESDSSRQSSAADQQISQCLSRKHTKYFSLSRFSSEFRKNAATSGSSAAVNCGAKEVLRKQLKKVKPLCEKLFQKLQQQQQKMPSSRTPREFMAAVNCSSGNTIRQIKQSCSGNLRHPVRRRSHSSSCPSSMISSPRHSESEFGFTQMGRHVSGSNNLDASSMEELQSAIQGAIAHCKNSMMMMKKVGDEI